MKNLEIKTRIKWLETCERFVAVITMGGEIVFHKTFRHECNAERWINEMLAETTLD